MESIVYAQMASLCITDRCWAVSRGAVTFGIPASISFPPPGWLFGGALRAKLQQISLHPRSWKSCWHIRIVGKKQQIQLHEFSAVYLTDNPKWNQLHGSGSMTVLSMGQVLRFVYLRSRWFLCSAVAASLSPSLSGLYHVSIFANCFPPSSVPCFLRLS